MKRIILNVALVVLLFALAPALLSSCATKIGSEIFVRDLDDLDDGNLTNKIAFFLPLTSMDECDEYHTRYDKVFSKSRDFTEMEFVQCVDGESNDYVEYEMDVPLRKIDPIKTDIDGAVDLIRYDENGSEGSLILIRANPPSLHDLDEKLEEEFHQGLDLSDSSPLIVISNDTRVDQVFTVNYVFARGVPVITRTSYTLEPRDDLNIVLSDVASAHIFHISETAEARMAPIGIWTTPVED